MAITAGALAAGAAISGVLGGASSALGSYKQYKYQKKLQAQSAQLNYKYGKKTALNQYGWTRKSLEDAGYNPILAVSQGPVGMSGGYTSAGSAQSEDYSGLVNSALDFARYSQEKELNKANVKKANADTRLSDTQADSNEISNLFAPNRIQAEIDNVNSAKDLNIARTTGEILKNEWYPKYMKSEISALNAGAYSNILNANSNNLNANVNKSVNSATAFDNEKYIKWSNKHPYLYSFDKTMRRYGAGAIAGLAAYGSAKANSKKRPSKK